MKKRRSRMFRPFRFGIFVFSLFGLSPSILAASDIVVLLSDDNASFRKALEGFHTAIPPLEFLEYNMKGNSQLGGEIINQVKLIRPKVIVGIGARAADLARSEIPDVPIVYCMVINPNKYNLEGENITGVQLSVPMNEQFSFLERLLPRRKVVGVLYDPEVSQDLVDSAREASAGSGFILLYRPISSQNDIARELKNLIGSIDIFWLIPDSTLMSRESFKYILTATIEHDIPMLAFSSNLVKSGALISISPNYQSVGVAAAKLVRDILERDSRRQVRILAPEAEISLNLTTADSLGINITEELRQIAKHVF